jgi:hypothetical protein
VREVVLEASHGRKRGFLTASDSSAQEDAERVAALEAGLQVRD